MADQFPDLTALLRSTGAGALPSLTPVDATPALPRARVAPAAAGALPATDPLAVLQEMFGAGTQPLFQPYKPQAAPKIDDSSLNLMRQQEREARLAQMQTDRAEAKSRKDAVRQAPATAEAEIADMLGMPAGATAQATALTLGKVKPRIDVTSRYWADVLNSPVWQQLPVEEQERQQDLWVEARLQEVAARVTEAQGGKPPSDKALAEYRRKLELSQSSIAPRPARSTGEGIMEFVGDAYYSAKSLWANRDVRDADSPEEVAAAQERTKAARDALRANTSAWAANEQKKLALARQDMIDENVAKGLPPELTAAQQAQIGWKTFTSMPGKVIAGSLPGTAAGVAASLGGAVLGGLTPVPGGAVLGGRVAGATAGQEIISASVAGEIDDRISNLTEADLAKSPQYRELLSFYNNDARMARAALTHKLIEDTETEARALGAASGLIEGTIGLGRVAIDAVGRTAGGAAGRSLLAQALTRYGLPPVAKGGATAALSKALTTPAQGAIRSTATAVAGETAQEFGEEGAEQLLGNVALNRAALQDSLSEGVVEAGVLGALAGGTLAGGAKGVAAAGRAVGGPIEDQGDVVVGRDTKGRLAPLRKGRNADGSNLVIDPRTGLARLRSVDADVDPAAVTTMSQLNMDLLRNTAVTDGLSAEAGMLAGMGVNSVLLGDAAQGISLPLDIGGVRVGFIFAPDGTVAVADPQAPAAAVGVAAEANALLAQLQGGVKTFAAKQGGWSAPATTPVAPTPQPPAVSTTVAPTPQPPAPAPVAPTPQPAPVPPATVAPTPQPAPAPVAPTPQPAPVAPAPQPAPVAPAPIAPPPIAPPPIAPVAPPPTPPVPNSLPELFTQVYGLSAEDAAQLAGMRGFNSDDPVTISRAQDRSGFTSPQAIAARARLLRAFEADPEPMEQMAPAVAAMLRTAWYGTAMSSERGLATPDASGALWQRIVRVSPANRAALLLEGIAAGDGFSQAERNLADLLIRVFSSQQVPLPRVELAKGGETRANYLPNEHMVVVPKNNARAGRVLHEMLHAATVRGLVRIDNAARQGNAQAKAFSDLVTEVHQAMVKHATDVFGVPAALVEGDKGNPVYALRVYEEVAGVTAARPELQAELFNPMVLALAQSTPLSELELSEKARSALGRIMTGSGTRDVQPGVTLFDAIVSLVQDVIRWASGKPLTEPELSTVSEALAAIAAEAASEAGRAFREANPNRAAQGRGAGATYSPADTGDRDAIQVESPGTGVLRGQGQEVGLRQDGQGNQVDQGPAGASQNQAQGPQALSPRAPGAVLAAARAGRQAPPATVPRGLTQALTRKGATPAQRRAAALPFLRQLGDRITEMFADALLPMVRWVQALPVPEGLRNDLLGAMYRAPNVRDNITRQAMEQFGGQELQQSLARLLDIDRTRQPNATAEDVVFHAGYWLTAQYAPVKNRRMLQVAEDELIQAQQALAAAVQAGAPRADIALLQASVGEAQSVFDDRQFAMAQPADVNLHVGVSGKPVGLAGGMNDAQAAEFIRTAEQRYGRAALQEMARHVYRMNAFRLATDLETGRTTPDLAAQFSPETAALRTEMEALATAANDPRPNQAQLERLREAFVSKLAARSKYVPTSGDGSKELEQDVLGQGFKTPNVARDRRLQGRTSSLADDGITASLGGMQRSAAAAGWDDFTRLVQRAYYDMTPDQRRAADIREVDITILDRLGDNLVIRGDKGYAIGNGKELAALRKENVDDRSQIWSIVESPTRAFAYAATQLNPAFGLYNMVRDTWERSEFLRTRSLVNARGQRVDATKAAQRMIQLVASGDVLRDLRQALWSRDPAPAARNSKYAQLLREFEELGGGGSKFATALSRDRGQLALDIEKAGSNTRRLLAGLGKVVARWNEVFDSVAALSAYAALREQGMSKEAAAAATLDLMNFRKGGAAMPAVRAFYAFAQPAVTGGVNMVRLLKTPRGRKRMLGYVVAFGVLQSLMASLAGDDDELGRNKMDLLDEYTKDRTLPIPIPGTDMIAKMPIGFGMPMLANIIVRQAREFAQGDVTLGEAISEAAGRGVVPAFTPLEDVKLRASDDPMRWLLQTFSPTVARPLTNVAINRSGLGGEVVREAFLDKDKYKSEQGSPLTPEDYKALAVELRTTFGVDLAPEQVREIVRGYSLGVFRTALQMAIEDPHKALTGRPTEIPVVRTLVSGYNSNALITEMASFEREGRDLLRERNANPEGFEASPRGEAVLQLYEQWTEAEKELRQEAAGLTRAGVDRGINPQRLQLREKREAVQANFVRQFNEIPR